MNHILMRMFIFLQHEQKKNVMNRMQSTPKLELDEQMHFSRIDRTQEQDNVHHKLS